MTPRRTLKMNHRGHGGTHAKKTRLLRAVYVVSA
jgi:hypothetical protein